MSKQFVYVGDGYLININTIEWIMINSKGVIEYKIKGEKCSSEIDKDLEEQFFSAIGCNLRVFQKTYDKE